MAMPGEDVDVRGTGKRVRKARGAWSLWSRGAARVLLGLIVAWGLVAPRVAAADPDPGAGELRGVWIHTYSPYDWDRVMRQLRDTGFNAVFVRVGRGGNVLYPSSLLPMDAWAEKAGGDELKRAIQAAHRYGLDFHAWRVCYHMGSAPKEYRARMAAEDRLARDPDGKQALYANPADPRNNELEYAAVMEVVRKYDIDGIHLDYIRYPSDPHYNFDYGPRSRAEFEKATGQKVAQWPEDVISGPLKRAYEEFERECVNSLMERVYRGVKREKPRVQVSAAVWRNHRRYRAVIKQDWPLWIERGWMDFVVPMDYTADDEVYAATVKEQVAMASGKMPVVIGIGAWLLKDPAHLVRQVELARQAGASGHVLFAYNARGIDAMLDALAKGPHRLPAKPAYRAPRICFELPDAIARKDAPHAVEAERPFSLAAAWKAGRVDRSRGVQLTLETPGGRCLAQVGQLSPRSELRAEPLAPADLFQVVARGVLGGMEVVTRGPLLEGRPAAEIEALRAQENPPHVPDGALPRVAVYEGGMGAAGILAALEQSGQVRAFSLHRLRPDHLAAADAVILPQLRDVADLTRDAEEALRAWVASGGTLLLTHDAVGFRWHPAPFPEIGVGAALARRQPLLVTTRGADAWSLEYAYSDHVRITPARGATVVAREKDAKGAPVVVSGAFEKGRVILCGIIPGLKGTGELLPGEARLLLELLTPAEK